MPLLPRTRRPVTAERLRDAIDYLSERLDYWGLPEDGLTIRTLTALCQRHWLLVLEVAVPGWITLTGAGPQPAGPVAVLFVPGPASEG